MGYADRDVVIVGAGRAGHALARALRRRNALCTITLIAGHAAAVYPKSALTTALRHGREPATLIQATGDMVASREDLHLLEQSPVETIDLVERSLEMPTGRIPFQQLVLALGEESRIPQRLAGCPGVFPVNRLADYSALRARLMGARRVVILGAGVAALEFANDLVASTREVVLVDRARHPLGERLPGLAGSRLRRDLERAGVRFRLDDRVMSVDSAGHRRFRVHTASGERLDADAVVSLMVPRPRTGLAQRAGIATTARGIVVDCALRTGVDGVFALGACANLPAPIRWAGIESQATALAESLCGRVTDPDARPEAWRLNAPACPLVLCDPPPIAGEWHERATRDSVVASFHDRAGRLRGFALVGAAVEQRERWLALLQRD